MDSIDARLIENTAAIRELTAASQAERRTKDRLIQWLLVGLAALGALAGVLGFAAGALGN